MKKRLCIGLCLCLLLCGCQKQNTAKFYYQRASYVYGKADGVIAAEKRDITGNEHNLPFLISLYLVGPLSDEYTVPFNGKVKLLQMEEADGILSLTFTDCSSFLSDLQFTVSCASLAMTCVELCEADCITIHSGERTLSLTRDVLTLYDSGLPNAATEGETK